MQTPWLSDDFGIIGEVENNASFLSCAIEALYLLREDLERNLCIREKSSGGMGYYLQVCSAMVPVLRDLDRISQDLDAVIHAVYAEKKRGKVCQD